MTTIEHNPPLQGKPEILCRHCHQELEATGSVHEGVQLQGFTEYVWRHVDTASRVCTQSFDATPWDGWAATRQISAAREDARDE